MFGRASGRRDQPSNTCHLCDQIRTCSSSEGRSILEEENFVPRYTGGSIMKRFSSRRYLRKTVIGLFAILGLAGMPREAPAFQFNNGDLVLAIYSTNGQASTEFYYD